MSPPFSIPYQQGDGTIHRYLPDFLVTYIDSKKEIIEIKPSTFVNYDINVQKFEAAKEYCQINCMSFKIITECDFKFTV
jgi:hypothetical protein